MLGSIAGDIIGSVHEFVGTKTTDFPLFTLKSTFTDDTVLTLATADKLLKGGNYANLYRKWGNKYPDAGYGGRFAAWLGEPVAGPYNSFGNGSAMRVAPVGWAFETIDEVMEEAWQSAAVTHNHPQGIKGAQAVASAVFMARKGRSKAEIKAFLTKTFKYDLKPTVAQIRPSYGFDETCQGSVPQALICFLESTSYESAVRKAISLGGDADTLACIAGGIAEAFYGLPTAIESRTRKLLPGRMLEIVNAFRAKYITKEIAALPVQPAQSVQPQQPPQNRHRLIVLDDDKNYLKVIVKVLENRFNLQIIATTDTDEAVREAVSNPPVAFLTDIIHEGMNGLELLKYFKRHPVTRNMPVWVVSGNIGETITPEDVERLGADFVGSKPQRFSFLVDLLAKRLKQLDGR